MNTNVLVTYASVSGSTGEVAEAIGQVLEGHNLKVWVQPMKSVSDLETYDAIIAGSSIRAGRWLPEAMRFLDNFQETLNRKTVAYFTTCLTMVHDDEDSRRTVMAYMEPILQKTPDINPIGLGMFAGSLDRHRQQMMHIDGPQGDYRNWEAIRAWTGEIAPLLIEHAETETTEKVAKPEYTINTIILRNAVLAYTDMSKSNLSGVDLSGADMYEADLSNSDLREATLNWAEMNWATMSHADFSRANLIGADLQKATVDGANFSYAILNGADLSHANLSGADLSGADLNWVDLRGANLSQANLTEAKLGWANLQGADLSGVTLDKVTYNTATQWPDDFVIEEHGGILVDIGPR